MKISTLFFNYIINSLNSTLYNLKKIYKIIPSFRSIVSRDARKTINIKKCKHNSYYKIGQKKWRLSQIEIKVATEMNQTK